jgi:uncharacterized protein YndB with AHSA1/START domain
MNIGVRSRCGGRSRDEQVTKRATSNPTLRANRKIVMMRVFNAPRRAVFDALTKPELVKRWLVGPPGWSMVVCDIDLKVGGTYRYLWRRHSDGADVAMGGVFRELVPPERTVQTERFDEDGNPGESLVTTVLTERGGKTTLTRMITMIPEGPTLRKPSRKKSMSPVHRSATAAPDPR